MRVLANFCSVLSLAGMILMAGCGVQRGGAGLHADTAGVSGNVHGGQQAVGFSTIQLYTVGTTGDGSASTPLLTQTVTSDASGNFTFNFPNAYSCTNATLVYVTATGGQPIPGTTNPNLAMMTALGQCSALTSGTFIQVNELTTVAAVSALAPFMTSYSAVGSGTSDVAALAAAFGLATELVNTASGQSPGGNVPAGTSVPTALINTLGNVVAACINSAGGVAGDPSPCGQLFMLTKPSGQAAPTDTIGALLDLANNPTLNTPGLFGLITPSAPFQPQLTVAPADFHVRLVPAAGAAQLQISPLGLTFTGTAVGFMSAAQAVTILNSGTTPVTFSVIDVTGANAADFAQTNQCASPLAAGASCTVQVTATPAANGARYGYLSIASSTPDSPQYVALAATGTAPSAGPVTVSPSFASFYTVNGDEDITVSNFGLTPLTIRSITLSNYIFTETNNCGPMLAAQSICTISVAVSNLAFDMNGFPITYTGTLTIDDDAAAGPLTLPLTSQAAARVNGPLGFGGTPVGYGTVLPLTFSMPSGANPRVTASYSVSVAGPNAGDFSLSSPNCAVFSPSSCSIQVTFKPSAAGLRTAKLFLNDGSYVPVSGTGISGPSIAYSGTSTVTAYLDQFGNASYSNIIIQVLNNGTTTLVLQPNASAFSFTGTNAANFGVSSNCGLLAVLATCSPVVNFTGHAVGTYTASLITTDLASNYSLVWPLTVSVLYQPIFVTPNTLSFGTTSPGATSAAQAFTVGAGPVVPLGHPISVSQPMSGNFTLPGGSTCAATTTLCTLSAAFTPQSAGTFSETLTVTDQTSGFTASLVLSGTGGTPTVSPSPSPLTFAPRAIGTTSIPVPMTITNNGTATLSISSVGLSGVVNANFSQTNNCTAVGVGGSCTINVTFAPTATGMQSATITIVSNAPSSPDMITVSGTAN